MEGDDSKILYILIGYGSKPLVGYGAYKVDFIHKCEERLKKVQPNKSATVSTSDYKIFYQNVDTITYLIMTKTSYPMGAAISCLESMQKEFGPDLLGKNLENVGNYGLNKEYQEKLKMKFEFYEKNTEVINEKTENLKIAMQKFHEEIVNEAAELSQRDSLVNNMMDKADVLEEASNEFKMRASNVRRAECCKKWKYIFAIIAVIAIIILIIVLIVYA